MGREYREKSSEALANLSESSDLSDLSDSSDKIQVVSQKVCKAECLFELQIYLFFSLCFP